ncbi:MAG: PspC domain-containing protein [Patescibacteria group bacterium]
MKKLHRSSNDRFIAGVCGGLGEYFSIDPTLVRIGWVVFTLVGGAGIIAYIILALIVPSDKKL